MGYNTLYSTPILRDIPFFKPIPVYEVRIEIKIDSTPTDSTYTEEIQEVIQTIFIPPAPLLTILFLFSVYPAIYSTEKFFRKRGDKNAVFEYMYIKKILYISLAVLIIIIIPLYYLQSWSIEHYLEGKGNLPEPYNRLTFVLQDILFVIPAVPISILLKLLLEHARKQFRFYYAKVCFKLISETPIETSKAGYLSWGLEWYNKFVKGGTKLYVMNMEAIYSKIMTHSPLSKNQILNPILGSFHDGDEFKPLRQMLSLLSDGKQDNVLVKEPFAAKIRELSTLVIPIVTVVITIVSTFFLQTSVSPASGVTSINQSVIEDCGENPEKFGFNQTSLWQCSMFKVGSLAEQCANNPYRFHMNSTSQCSKFIPPLNASGG